MSELPFVVPFIRWADVAHIRAGTFGPQQRRLYDHEIVLCVGGSGHIVLEGQSHEAIPNRLFFVQPRQWHSYLADCDEDLHLLGVHFDWIPQHDTLQFPLLIAADGNDAPDESLFRVPQPIADWNLDERPFLDLSKNTDTRAALEAVILEYSIGSSESQTRAGALLVAAIISISRAARSLSQSDEFQRVGPDAARRIERARILLQDVERNCSVEEIAETVGWSSDHLRRTFRAVYGVAPAAFHNTARLQRARLLLREAEKNVADVAASCGFENAEYFARWFKAESGLTPRQFRALSRQES
jgi:AraC-like DNA-binding protein